MKRLTALLLAGALSLATTARGDTASGGLESDPGFVDFELLDNIYGEPRVMINIGGMLLRFMAAASREDPEAAALIGGLEAVRVQVYPTGGELAPARDQIRRVKGILQQQDWQPVVQVREAREEVQIFMKGDEQRMHGLTVMTVNDEEAVFLNILGEIDPDRLGEVMDHLNVDVDVDVDENNSQQED